MERLHFKYSMRLYYSEAVNPCHFTIKIIPKDTNRQKLSDINIQMDPRADYSHGDDGFENKKIIGSVRVPHDHYYLDVEGIVDVAKSDFEEYALSHQIGMYRYPYGKAKAGDKIKEYYQKLSEEINKENVTDALDKALFIMKSLHRDFGYNTQVTDVNTTAEEAFCIGSGVCQDYTHVYITLMKLFSIPARYVAGLVIGEGESHAWAEVLIDDKWIGIDPTNDKLVNDEYIKLGNGRDAGDCKINLGIMYGGGNQRQEIDVKVWKE